MCRESHRIFRRIGGSDRSAPALLGDKIICAAIKTLESRREGHENIAQLSCPLGPGDNRRRAGFLAWYLK